MQPWMQPIKMYSKGGPAHVHHILLQYGEPPPKTAHCVVDLVVFDAQGVADPRHRTDGAAKICIFPSAQVGVHGLRRLLTKIQLLYLHSDCPQTMRFQLLAGDKPLGSIVVPAHYAGPIERNSHGARTIYEPAFVHLDKLPVMHYVGLEDRIMNETRTWVGTPTVAPAAAGAYRTFSRTDPLLVFMQRHAHLFEELSVDERQIRLAGDSDSIYFVKESLVSRAQRFFRTQVLPLIDYLPDDCQHLTLVAVPGAEAAPIAIQVQVDYVTVYPNGAWVWPCKEINVTPFI